MKKIIPILLLLAFIACAHYYFKRPDMQPTLFNFSTHRIAMARRDVSPCSIIFFDDEIQKFQGMYVGEVDIFYNYQILRLNHALMIDAGELFKMFDNPFQRDSVLSAIIRHEYMHFVQSRRFPTYKAFRDSAEKAVKKFGYWNSPFEKEARLNAPGLPIIAAFDGRQVLKKFRIIYYGAPRQ